MARSSPRPRRSGGRSRAPASASPLAGVVPPGPSLASAVLPRVWQGVGYRPLPDLAAARTLFEFAAVPWPDPRHIAVGWGAFTASGDAEGGERLIGAIVGERAERSMMLSGPVVVGGDDPMEIAAQLVAAALDHTVALGADTAYARPHGLDRVWVRFGFIPLPESSLPPALAGRPGVGLFAWRGGSALWSLRETVAE